MTNIKSKQRVRELAEVFTADREVNAMLDLVAPAFETIDKTFLEPACGTGNFLIKILQRKLEVIRKLNEEKRKTRKQLEFNIVKAVSSIYAVDICPENVNQSRERLLNLIVTEYPSFFKKTSSAHSGFLTCIKYVLEKNIVEGDTINKLENIIFFEYTFNDKDKTVKRTQFRPYDEQRKRREYIDKYNEGRDLVEYDFIGYLELC
jgi:hypothetical protein